MNENSEWFKKWWKRKKIYAKMKKEKEK